MPRTFSRSCVITGRGVAPAQC